MAERRTGAKHTLAGLQQAFVAAIGTWDGPTPAGVVAHSGALTARMNTYRRNVNASLIGVLESHFPVVARLTGSEFFRAMAQLYLAEQPPRSPVLLGYGGGFADFIARFEPAADVPYLADVARLEWLQNEAYHAQDAEPLSSAALAALDPAQLSATRFDLHPSLRLLQSRFPALAIWRTNAQDAEVQPVDFDKGGDELLIARPADRVVIQRLPVGGVAFVADLVSGANLGTAAAAAMARSDHTDLQQVLASVISSQCLIGYALTLDT